MAAYVDKTHPGLIDDLGIPRDQNPPTYTAGLGELIRSHRLYIGLVARGMAKHLQLDRRDYQRIENGQDDCPPGLLDKVGDLVDKFDNDVSVLIEAALRETITSGDPTVSLTVSDNPAAEWERCVVARAAVEAIDMDEPLAILPVMQRQ